jgi:SM-20-related protein
MPHDVPDASVRTVEPESRRDLPALRVSSLCHRSRNYRELRRCGGFVDEHFLNDEQCAGLVASMRQGDRLPASVYRKDSDNDIADDIRRVHTTTVPETVAAVVASRFDALRPLLAAHFETSLETYEGPEYLIYRPGDFFGPHTDDAHEQIAQRKISVVVFLNTQQVWEGDGGHGDGELVLYGLGAGVDKAGQYVGLPGVAGSLVAFPADTVHEVLPVAWGERCAVVGWYR